MLADFDFAVAADFGTALLLGALIGVEREKRNEREGFGIAGLRSFIMLAQLGAIAGFLTRTLTLTWLLPAVLVATGAVLVAGYFAAQKAHPDRLGLTTELAALATVLLGALATSGHREVAAGLGVTTAVLLAYKQPLHGMVGKLAWDDVLVGLRFLSAAFVVLPLLPDRAIDPYGAINPYKLWLLVLLISGLSLCGYVASRWLGPGRGIAVTAATGGLVSSTAVTLTLVGQSRADSDDGGRRRQLAGGILLSWGVMFARVLVAASVVNTALLQPLLLPFAAMALCCAAVAATCFWRRSDAAAPKIGTLPLKNPFSLLAAGRFALLFALVQLLIGVAREHLPRGGIYAIAVLAGLTDVDAITLSMAEQARAGDEALRTAVVAIGLAAASNTLVKTGMAVFLGRGLGRTMAIGTTAITAALALSLWLG